MFKCPTVLTCSVCPTSLQLTKKRKKMSLNYSEGARISNASFIRARDPSIIAWNRPGLSKVRTNLESEMQITTKSTETDLAEEADTINVFLRIKNEQNFDKLYSIENEHQVLACKVPPGSKASRNVRDKHVMVKKFTFSKVFPPDTTQVDLFNSIVKGKLLDFINGDNFTLMTYGATGSGKTFTLLGTGERPGIIPRSLEYLFRTIPNIANQPLVKPIATGDVIRLDDAGRKRERQFRDGLLNVSSSTMDKMEHTNAYRAMQARLSGEPVGEVNDDIGVSIEIWVSFAEIYNEQIFDLLQPGPLRGKNRPPLRLGAMSTSNGVRHYIKNLSFIHVANGLEAYQVLQYGIHNLNYAATNLNAHSSRSHSIFTVKIVQVCEADGSVYASDFNFCDLAGSERSKKTMNAGERLKESNNINSSLLVLGRCISMLRDSQKNNDHRLIPYRESKLTQLFQRALAGSDGISIIVSISPSTDMFDETQQALKFAAIAQEITLKAPSDDKKSADMSREETEEEIGLLRNQISELMLQLEAQKNEFESETTISLDFLRNGYNKIIADMQNHHRENITKLEEKCKDQARKIAALEAKLANCLKDSSSSDTDKSVILLDDSIVSAPPDCSDYLSEGDVP